MGFQASVFRLVPSSLDLFLLSEEIEVQLSDLELTDIAIRIEAGGKLDMIFHKGIFAAESSKADRVIQSLLLKASGGLPFIPSHKRFIRMASAQGSAWKRKFADIYYICCIMLVMSRRRSCPSRHRGDAFISLSTSLNDLDKRY
jgi:acyl carrier protein phosphodiesterase